MTGGDGTAEGRRWTSFLPRRVIAVVALVGGLAVGGHALGWFGNGGGEPLKLYGNVEIREASLGFRVGGRIAQWLVDEGDVVQPGELLVRLDTAPLRARLDGAEARLVAANAAVTRDADGSRPQQVSAAVADADAAVANLAEARRQYDRRNALYAKGFLGKADLQTAEATVTTAAARVDSANAALSLAREGVRAEDRDATRAARGAAAADVRAASTDLADSEIRAVERGQVMTRAQEAGAIVAPGQTVLTEALTQPVRVRAYVAEPDLPRIHPGMKVRVTTDGTGQVWQGVIGFIAPQAEFTPKSVETEQLRTDLVYRLRITVDDPAGGLRQGQPVTVLVDGEPQR